MKVYLLIFGNGNSEVVSTKFATRMQIKSSIKTYFK